MCVFHCMFPMNGLQNKQLEKDTYVVWRYLMVRKLSRADSTHISTTSQLSSCYIFNVLVPSPENNVYVIATVIE